MSIAQDGLSRQIEHRWNELGESGGTGLRVVDLPTKVGAGALLLGVGADGDRLLVPLSTDAAREMKEDRSGSVVQLTAQVLEHGDGRRSYAELVCRERELRWLFASLVADVITRLEARRQSPVAVVRACLAGWRSLFSGAGRPLTTKQLAGLFAELEVLRRLLDRSTSAVEAWRGPLRHAHDFVAGSDAVEVKGTLSTEDSTVWIHGLEQLTEPQSGRLTLAHLRLESSRTDGRSVPEVVDAINELIPSSKFKGLVAASGYREEHVDSYTEIKFRVVEERWHAVGANFPRLTAATFENGVPAGLAEFRYTLDLSTVAASGMAATEVEERLRGMAGG